MTLPPRSQILHELRHPAAYWPLLLLGDTRPAALTARIACAAGNHTIFCRGRPGRKPPAAAETRRRPNPG
jgi:hypothetical protein